MSFAARPSKSEGQSAVAQAKKATSPQQTDPVSPRQRGSTINQSSQIPLGNNHASRTATEGDNAFVNLAISRMVCAFIFGLISSSQRVLVADLGYPRFAPSELEIQFSH